MFFMTLKRSFLVGIREKNLSAVSRKLCLYSITEQRNWLIKGTSENREVNSQSKFHSGCAGGILTPKTGICCNAMN
jgi:hypothetical protein